MYNFPRGIGPNQDPNYPPQYFYPNTERSGQIPPGMFNQNNPFLNGFPAQPVLIIVGFRAVPIQNPDGLLYVTQLPVYDYVYPNPAFFIPQSHQPIQADANPPAIESCPLAASVTENGSTRQMKMMNVEQAANSDLNLSEDSVGLDTVPSILNEDREAVDDFFGLDPQSTAAVASSCENSSATQVKTLEPKQAADPDLNLSEDSVGLNVALPIQEDDRDAVDQFFGPKLQLSQTGSFDHAKILELYIAKARTGPVAHYLPSRNIISIQEHQLNSSVSLWEDAMLHNPPIEMLRALNRIQCIFTTFQSSPNRPKLPTYMFPCSLFMPKDFKKRNAAHYKIKGLIANEDRMVLEVTLKLNGVPVHVFIRKLKDNEAYLDKNLRDKKDDVLQALDDSKFPILSQRAQNRSQSSTSVKGVTETDMHIEFYSTAMKVAIKAPKKQSKNT